MVAALKFSTESTFTLMPSAVVVALSTVTLFLLNKELISIHLHLSLIIIGGMDWRTSLGFEGISFLDVLGFSSSADIREAVSEE